MKIYKDFHNLSFPRHILQKFHFGFKFYCAYYQFRDRFHCAKQKNLSVTPAACHLSYRGEALAFRKAFPFRQRLPSVGELSSDSETERFFFIPAAAAISAA